VHIAPGTPPAYLGLVVACIFALPGDARVVVCHWAAVDRGYLSCEGRL
jgi:hypothetical protein